MTSYLEVIAAWRSLPRRQPHHWQACELAILYKTALHRPSTCFIITIYIKYRRCDCVETVCQNHRRTPAPALAVGACYSFKGHSSNSKCYSRPILAYMEQLIHLSFRRTAEAPSTIVLPASPHLTRSAGHNGSPLCSVCYVGSGVDGELWCVTRCALVC